MTDRAADNDFLLWNLKVKLHQILKCYCHVFLGVGNACDTVYRDAEQRFGVINMRGTSVGNKTFPIGYSVHTLGEIAISKLFSISHAAHSVSLYYQFIEWLKDNGIEQSGFTSICFGTISKVLL